MLHLIPFKETAGYCGPASLKIVLTYYGLKISEKKLAKLSHHSLKKGNSADDLVKASLKLGFMRSYVKTPSSLAEIRRLLQKK